METRIEMLKKSDITTPEGLKFRTAGKNLATGIISALFEDENGDTIGLLSADGVKWKVTGYKYNAETAQIPTSIEVFLSEETKSKPK